MGAHAVAFHGFPRLTGDIDFFFDRTHENVAKLHKALNEFGFPFTEKQLLEENKVFQMGVVPNRIDLLNWISGIEFKVAWENKVMGKIDDLDLFFISKNDLLINKKASNRKKDLIDIEALK